MPYKNRTDSTMTENVHQLHKKTKFSKLDRNILMLALHNWYYNGEFVH